ncbi:MAG TPA: FdhF/YdeP family oxidoreductase [Actinomycetota bacterium]|nr:FdhF/YdeP family oxidoreductase [Actinomycetota bacterium]
MARRRRTKDWVGPIPYGIGQVKPNHYGEMLRVAWENKNHPLYAWRILRDGVCDGCALGTTGLHDFTMDGVHLCTVRLNLLRLNTMDAIPSDALADVGSLEAKSSKELRDLGRLGYPMLRRRGEAGFSRVSWDTALRVAADVARAADPQRLAFYLTSRGITNEVYYVAQKVARFLGTNNIDNAARLCHSPSTVAMKQTLGVAASTCSYSDWIGSDLIVFIGSDVANNQPVTTKYLYYAKRKDTKIAVVNPYREPGMMRYWVPSVAESAMFGTKICDEFYGVHTGGDLAFLNGALKHLVARDLIDRSFIEAHTSGFADVVASVESQRWDDLERASGASRADMERFAEMLGRARNGILVWSMGVTQHRHGVDTVKAILNIALARGWIGREHSGVMPIRGHSGVQGGAEVGCVPNALPGGVELDEDAARALSGTWGFDVPTARGMTAAEMIAAAERGKLDMLWSAGGNFLETLPEPDAVRHALESVPYRIHQDIVCTTQMLVEPREWALILPARTRYEQPGGGTETTTERQIIYSPEIPGPRPAEARSEWEIFMDFAERVHPQRREQIHFESADEIRREIARTVPFYAGIETLREKGDHVQWGGRILCEDGTFATDDGRARFSVVEPPESRLSDGSFLLSTRRGKQFNSMVHRTRDPLTGAVREDVLMAKADAARIGVEDGDAVIVRSAIGTFNGRVKVTEMKERNVQMHWPESQALLARGELDPHCGVPDYNAVVTIERTPA